MNKVKHIFYFLGFFLFILTGCSEDDSIGNRGPENSFLAINEKTAFESRDDLIFRFLNNTTNPFEQFEIVNEPVQCFANYKNFVEAPFWFENLEMLENNENTLKIRYTDIQDPNNTSVVIMEFTDTGGALNLRWNDSEADEDNWILSRTALAYTDYEYDCN